MGILKLLFLVTLLTLPLAQLARIQLSGNINSTLFDAFVMLTGAIWMSIHLVSRRRAGEAFLFRPILLVFLVMLLSLLVNIFRYSVSDTTVALLYALRWVFFASVYFVVWGFDEKFKKIIPDFLVTAGSVLVLFGYIQFFFYPNLRNLYYLGWDEHLVRMFSTLLDPNFFGAFLVLFFIFLLGLLTKKNRHSELPARLWRVQNLSGLFIRTNVRDSGVVPPRNDGRLGMIILSMLAILTFIAIFLTTSRSAILMLMVSLCTYLILIGKKKWIMAFFGVLLGIFLLSSRFFYIENINPFRIASSLARVESAFDALSIIQRNPVLGVGFNAYRYAQYEYELRNPETSYPNHADSGTDNSFLFILATTGIGGLVVYLFMLFTMFKLGRRAQGMYGKILLACLAGLVIDSFFINSLFYPVIMFWMWVLAGLTDYT